MDRRSFLLAAAAAPVALQRLPPTAAGGRAPRPGAGGFADGASSPRPLVYVTADLESHVAVVDLDHRTVVHRIKTQPDPRSIERVGDARVVAHTVSGRLSIIRNGDVVHEVDAMAEPRYTAADGNIAWVTDSGEPSVVAVDVERGTIVRRIKLKQWPRHISRRGDTLVIALGTASSEVAVVRHGDVRYRKTPYEVHDVGFSPQGKLWLTEASPGPQHVTFLHGRVYITNGSAGTLKELTTDGRVLRTVDVPVGSYNVQFGADRVFTPSLNAGTLAVLDGPMIRVARSSHDAC